MDFVNKAYAQLAELFRSLTPGSRIAAGLLLAVVVISIVYLFQFQASGGDEFLLGGRPFSASELTQIEAAFAKASLGKSVLEGSRVRIPRGQKDVYLAALAENNALPADFYKYLDEAAASDSPFASSKSMEMKRWNAKQKELALIISRMRGVQSATVQYDEASQGGLRAEKQKTAMVAVQTEAGLLEEGQIKAIRNVVASAYAGLDRQNISITDMTSGLSAGGGGGEGGLSEDESLYAAHKQRYERDWQKKIYEQLSMIPGVIVGVNVELSPELRHTTQTVKLDTKPIAVFASDSSKEASSSPVAPSGRPGAVPNGVGNQPIAVASSQTGGNQSTTTESRSETRNVPGTEQVIMQHAPLTPTKVTASIDVPASYFTNVWRQRNPPVAGQPAKPPDAAEIARIETETSQKIQETVRTLLPSFAQGTNPYPHITVASYTDIPAPPITPPGTLVLVTDWLQENWQTLGMAGVALFSLLMVRSMVRSAGSPSPTSAAALAAAPAHTSAPGESDEAEADDADVTGVLRRKFGGNGPDLRIELRDLVKEDPDAAANILRSWIGDAA
jgi:flagellar M-ring protein FliF